MAKRTTHPEPTSTELLTVPEAARLMRLATPTVYQRCAARQIEHVRIGRKILISRAEVDRLIAEGTVKRAA